MNNSNNCPNLGKGGKVEMKLCKIYIVKYIFVSTTKYFCI